MNPYKEDPFFGSKRTKKKKKIIFSFSYTTPLFSDNECQNLQHRKVDTDHKIIHKPDIIHLF